MRGKITKRAVDALTAARGVETVLWDTGVKGFGSVPGRPAGGATSCITALAPAVAPPCAS